jgi:2-methylcitrate dehydratase PrpD
MTIATELAGRIRAFTYDCLPNAAVEGAKMGILDTVGVTLAGSRKPCARIGLRSHLCDGHCVPI